MFVRAGLFYFLEALCIFFLGSNKRQVEWRCERERERERSGRKN
jgi:hypothetical protein